MSVLAAVRCDGPHKRVPEADCPGGVEIVLDPERVLFRGFEVGSEYVGTWMRGQSVRDILDVLDEEAGNV